MHWLVWLELIGFTPSWLSQSITISIDMIDMFVGYIPTYSLQIPINSKKHLVHLQYPPNHFQFHMFPINPPWEAPFIYTALALDVFFSPGSQHIERSDEVVPGNSPGSPLPPAGPYGPSPKT